MQRDKWTFEYGADDLMKATQKKVEFHQGRVKFWSESKAKVMAEIKDSGLEVVESMAGTNYQKSGFAPHVAVRNDLQEKLTECHRKINEHNDKFKEYVGWAQVMAANPKARFHLNADDYLFFFGE